MTQTLEFIGKPGPWRNVAKFIDQYRAVHPSATPQQIENVIHRENARKRARHGRSKFQVFGADILSDDLESMDAWPYLPRRWKRDLPLFPLTTGRLVRSADDDAPAYLQAAISTHGVHKVNRHSLLVPFGLSKTYVWREENQFMQQVSDADVAIIRNTPILNLMFRDPNRAAGPLRIQGFRSQPTGERYTFTSVDDAQAFERSMTSRPQWKGV